MAKGLSTIHNALVVTYTWNSDPLCLGLFWRSIFQKSTCMPSFHGFAHGGSAAVKCHRCHSFVVFLLWLQRHGRNPLQVLLWFSVFLSLLSIAPFTHRSPYIPGITFLAILVILAIHIRSYLPGHYVRCSFIQGGAMPADGFNATLMDASHHQIPQKEN